MGDVTVHYSCGAKTKLTQSLRGTSVCGVEDGRKEVLEVCLQSVQVLGEICTLRKITGV